jgi:hypothetical protein
MGRVSNMYGRDKKCIENVGQKIEGKRPLGRCRYR